MNLLSRSGLNHLLFTVWHHEARGRPNSPRVCSSLAQQHCEIMSIFKCFGSGGAGDEDTSHLADLASKDINTLTNEDVNRLRATYNRFRVLVLGPANAGKTTLLERLSNSSAGQATVTRDGHRVRFLENLASDVET
jgi:hypothetical protein